MAMVLSKIQVSDPGHLGPLVLFSQVWFNISMISLSICRIIDPGHGDPVIASEIDFTGYSKAMDNLRRIMPIVGFTNQVLSCHQCICFACSHTKTRKLSAEVGE